MPSYELKDHIIICNWNDKGLPIVKQLHAPIVHLKRPIVIVAERLEEVDLPDKEDMPELEDLTEKGHPYAEIESVKAVADVLSPISGEVAEINETLTENLDNLSNDPFGSGWLAKIKISYPDELKGLLSPKEYEAHLKEEEKKH